MNDPKVDYLQKLPDFINKRKEKRLSKFIYDHLESVISPETSSGILYSVSARSYSIMSGGAFPWVSGRRKEAPMQRPARIAKSIIILKPAF